MAILLIDFLLFCSISGRGERKSNKANFLEVVDIMHGGSFLLFAIAKCLLSCYTMGVAIFSEERNPSNSGC